MIQLIRYSRYLFHFISHHPPKQVYIMDALVHKGSSVLLPCTAPFCLCIVVLVPAPADMRCPIKHTPETPVFHRFPYLLHRFIKPILMTCTDFDLFLFRRPDNRIRIFQRQCNRLFNNHIAACFYAVQGNRCMLPGLRCNCHQLRLLLLKHLMIIRILPNTFQVKF